MTIQTGTVPADAQKKVETAAEVCSELVKATVMAVNPGADNPALAVYSSLATLCSGLTVAAALIGRPVGADDYREHAGSVKMEECANPIAIQVAARILGGMIRVNSQTGYAQLGYTPELIVDSMDAVEKENGISLEHYIRPDLVNAMRKLKADPDLPKIREEHAAERRRVFGSHLN